MQRSWGKRRAYTLFSLMPRISETVNPKSPQWRTRCHMRSSQAHTPIKEWKQDSIQIQGSWDPKSQAVLNGLLLSFSPGCSVSLLWAFPVYSPSVSPARGWPHLPLRVPPSPPYPWVTYQRGVPWPTPSVHLKCSMASAYEKFIVKWALYSSAQAADAKYLLTRRLKEQKCIVSQLWRPESDIQGWSLQRALSLCSRPWLVGGQLYPGSLHLLSVHVFLGFQFSLFIKIPVILDLGLPSGHI